MLQFHACARGRRIRVPSGHGAWWPGAVLSLLLALALPAGLIAQEGGPLLTGLVTGTVRDSLGLPVAGAEVGLSGLLVHGTTADDGVYRIAGVPTGPRVVRVRRLGFRPDSVLVQVLPGGTVTADVVLRVVAQQIAAVVIEAGHPQFSGRMASFFERRARGFGTFFTAEEIDRRHPSRLTDLLRTVPGVRLEQQGHERVVLFRGARCAPLIWIDGAPATAGYLDPDIFHPGTIAGIEVYPGPATVPSELMWVRGKGACGVIALWTRLDDPPGRRPTQKVSAQDLANAVASLRLYTAAQVDSPARPDSADPPAPLYPDSLQRSGRSGRVMAEFVVDTAGRAEMETFGIVYSSDPLFTDAVRRAVGSASFIPARLGSRPVRQVVQMPFNFVSPPGDASTQHR